MAGFISKKSFAIIGLVVIVLTIPLAVIFSGQQQIFFPQAHVSSIGDSDSCNRVHLGFSESPSCPALTSSTDGNNTCTIPDPNKKNLLSQYSFTITLSSKDGKAHKVVFQKFNFFCSGGYADLSKGLKDCHCTDNLLPSVPETLSVGSTGTQRVNMMRNSPNGQACGSYQFDFFISSVDGNPTCTFGTSQPHPGAVGKCLTGIDCTASTPTPTPSVSPTPTVPTTPTPTPTPGLQCQPNQAICQWDPSTNATGYHYVVTDTGSGTTVGQGDVNAPLTSASFPSVKGHSYSCTVTPTNSCGSGNAGTGMFTCAPTPTICAVPQTPSNVQISCPNCASH